MTYKETLTIKLSKDDKDIIERYAKAHGLPISQLVKKATLEKIEDDIDLLRYEEAMKKYNKNTKSYNLQEAEKMLGL